MKIYINNFNIEILNKLEKQLKIQKQFVNSETYIQIYALDGTYQINDKYIYKQYCYDNNIQIYEKYYDNFTLIVDSSYYKLEIINSIHSEHISLKIKKNFFKFDKNNNIYLVIEGNIIDENQNTIEYNDIYFELQNNEQIDINNILIKKEIIEFLSLLNNIII
jgi:hypothetical protein